MLVSFSGFAFPFYDVLSVSYFLFSLTVFSVSLLFLCMGFWIFCLFFNLFNSFMKPPSIMEFYFCYWIIALVFFSHSLFNHFNSDRHSKFIFFVNCLKWKIKWICPAPWTQLYSFDINYIVHVHNTMLRVCFLFSFIEDNYKIMKFKWSIVKLSMLCVEKTKTGESFVFLLTTSCGYRWILFCFFKYSYFQFIFSVIMIVLAYLSLITE